MKTAVYNTSAFHQFIEIHRVSITDKGLSSSLFWKNICQKSGQILTLIQF